MNCVEISVVLPVYRSVNGLSVTLKTVLHQNFQNFEIIIIDDGNDIEDKKFIKSLEKIDNRVRVISNEANLGIAESLARGCREAKAPFIARVDNMDLMVPSNRLDKQLSILKNNSKLALVGGNMELIDCINCERYKTKYYLQQNDNAIEAIQKRPCFSHPTVMFSKEVYDSVGGYDGNLKADEDYDLWYRMLQVGSGLIMNDVFVIATMRWNSISVEKNNRQIWMKMRRIFREGTESGGVTRMAKAVCRLGLELPKFLIPVRQRLRMRYRRWHEYLGPIAPEDVASLEALYRFYEREGYFRGGAEIKSKSPALTHDAAALRQISP